MHRTLSVIFFLAAVACGGEGSSSSDLEIPDCGLPPVGTEDPGYDRWQDCQRMSRYLECLQRNDGDCVRP